MNIDDRIFKINIEMLKISKKIFDWYNDAKKTFPNYDNIVEKFVKGEILLDDDFQSKEYCRDVIHWYIRFFNPSYKKEELPSPEE